MGEGAALIDSSDWRQIPAGRGSWWRNYQRYNVDGMYGWKRSYRRGTGCLSATHRMTSRTEDNRNVLCGMLTAPTSGSGGSSNTSTCTAAILSTTSSSYLELCSSVKIKIPYSPHILFGHSAPISLFINRCCHLWLHLLAAQYLVHELISMCSWWSCYAMLF